MRHPPPNPPPNPPPARSRLGTRTVWVALGLALALAVLLLPLQPAGTASVTVPASRAGHARVHVSDAVLVKLAHAMSADGTVAEDTTVWLARVPLLSSVRVRAGSGGWVRCVWRPWLTDLSYPWTWAYTCSGLNQRVTNTDVWIDAGY